MKGATTMNETEALAIVDEFQRGRINCYFMFEGGRRHVPPTAIGLMEFDSMHHACIWVRNIIDAATIVRERRAELTAKLSDLRTGNFVSIPFVRDHQNYDYRALEAAKRMTDPRSLFFDPKNRAIVGVDMARGPDTAVFDTMRIVNDGSKPTTHPPASERPSPVYEEWAAANAPKQPTLVPSTYGWKPESGNWVTRAEHDEVLKNFRAQNARLQEANKRDYASMNRAGRLADEAGILRAERDDLLKENARLRRAVEQLERKKTNRA